jgi:hypothetical protein
MSTADTAAACGCPRLPEAVAGQVAAGLVPPPLVRAGELALQPVAGLGAHVGHGRPLHGQGLLGGQPTKLEARQVAALPAADDRTGGRLRVDADPGPGVGGTGALVAPAGGSSSQTASMSWLASTTRSGSSASRITSVRSRGPTTSTGSPKPTRTSSGPSTPMVTSLATSATLPG